MFRFALCVVVSIASALSITTASAAPRTAPVYAQAPPVFTWSGFYVGAHGGYGWSHWSDPTTGINGNGALGGFQLGYNHQFGNLVAGVEGDFSFADVKHKESLFAGNITLKNDYFMTLAGRLGYAFDRALLYGKTGVAFTRDKIDANDGLGGTATGRFDRVGWLLGAGIEYAVWTNFSVKAEYNYLDFGSMYEELTTSGGLVATTASVKEHVHLLKLGVNYRF